MRLSRTYKGGDIGSRGFGMFNAYENETDIASSIVFILS